MCVCVSTHVYNTLNTFDFTAQALKVRVRPWRSRAVGELQDEGSGFPQGSKPKCYQGLSRSYLKGYFAWASRFRV